jgi:ABC-type transporter Mla subunit MlaD
LPPDNPGKPLAEGATIPTKTSTITAISERIEELMANITDITNEVNKGLKGMKEGQLNEIIKKVDSALDDGKKMLEDGRSVMADVRKVTEKINARADELLDQVDKLAKDADKFIVTTTGKVEQFDVAATQKSLEEVMKQLSDLGKKVDSTLSTLNDVASGAAYKLDDVEYSLRQTLQEVTTAFGSVKRIIDVLKSDPSSLLRGRGTIEEPRP